jgi:hypothetical protein
MHFMNYKYHQTATTQYRQQYAKEKTVRIISYVKKAMPIPIHKLSFAELLLNNATKMSSFVVHSETDRLKLLPYKFHIPIKAFF